MPNRSRTTFLKRQKELLRAEKQRDKTAKRLARKLAPSAGLPAEFEVELPEESQRLGEDGQSSDGDNAVHN